MFEINIFFKNNQIIESHLTHICQGSLGSTGPPRMAAVVPSAPFPRQFHPGMCAHLLEDREAWIVREGPPEDPRNERMGPSLPGNPGVNA